MNREHIRAAIVAAPVAALVACFALAASPTLAADLEPGTVIKASNLDEMKSRTFEGKTIASMLPEKLEWMIREQGLQMTLRPYEKVPEDPRWVEATRKYAKDVSLDAGTRLISGYQAGLPFPDVSMDEPQAALKLMWNHNRGGGYPRGTLQDYPLFAFLFINGNKGLERVQHWALIRYYMQGQLSGEPVLGDGSIYFKQLLFAHYPYDIRGLGTFAIRYTDGRKDDTWAYLRTVRRTRRLTGGAWMDPIGGTDQLNDEVEIMSAHVTWYPEYKLLGKRTMLAVAHSRWPPWDGDKKGNAAFPNVDLANAPYWNPVDDWEPREVYVIEAKTPDEHPYSKKIMYLDAETWVFYFAEAYDRKGELWKLLLFNCRPLKSEDDGWGVISNQGHTIDYQRKHATIFVHGKPSKFNTPGVGPDDVSLGVLEAAGQGRYRVRE